MGQDGNDTLYGGDGHDSLDGGPGQDKLHGQDGNDTLFGQDGNDTLYGGQGNDTLYGGNGNDRLVATTDRNDYGKDTWYGGGGADLFDIGRFDKKGRKDSTTIMDFNCNEGDRIYNLDSYNLSQLNNSVDIKTKSGNPLANVINTTIACLKGIKFDCDPVTINEDVGTIYINPILSSGSTSLKVTDVSSSLGVSVSPSNSGVKYSLGSQFNYLRQNQSVSDTLNITLRDAQGYTYSVPCPNKVYIQGLNDAPIDLDLGNKTIDENLAPGTVIGKLSTTDPDSGDSFDYELIAGDGDTDNTAFTIVGDQLQINDSPDYETKSNYSIRVQTTDGGGLSHSEQLTINVNDLNEAPTDLDLDNKTIDENVAPNSVVGTFSTTDPDSGDSFTYTLVTGNGDTDNSAFTINGDQLKINDSPDYETKSSYSIRVQTTDGEGASYQEQLTINVNDVNEDVIEGTPGKDIFQGSNTAENYSALAGNDRVHGNGGDDTIDGGEGNDIIYGGKDDDLLNGGLGRDRLYGDNGNDQLLGQDGNDILYGGAGDDVLNGGLGNDRYNGGTGKDTFVLGPGMGKDIIQGFEYSTDTIIDTIKLEGGIGFNDLDLNSGSLIKVETTREILASISGFDASLLGETHFTV